MNRCTICGNLFKRKNTCGSIFEQLMCDKCKKKLLKHKLSLGIGVLHYKESEEMLLNALKSIDNQKGIDFNIVKVIVMTDGGGVKIDETKLSSLKNIKPIYIYKDINEKVAGTRNSIIQNLDTDYIMFIDSDDEFASNKVFKRVLKYINKYKPNIYFSGVEEEQVNGKFVKYYDLMACNMTHGKAYNREWLLNTNIKFDLHCKVGEDTKFNTELYNICNNIYLDGHFIAYKWKFNSGSITRKPKDNIQLNSYFRCFKDFVEYFAEWGKTINEKNKFITEDFIPYLFNILYYGVKLYKVDKNTEDECIEILKYYLKDFNINYDGLKKVSKCLNKNLLKKIPYLEKAFTKLK